METVLFSSAVNSTYILALQNGIGLPGCARSAHEHLVRVRVGVEVRVRVRVRVVRVVRVRG